MYKNLLRVWWREMLVLQFAKWRKHYQCEYLSTEFILKNHRQTWSIPPLNFLLKQMFFSPECTNPTLHFVNHDLRRYKWIVNSIWYLIWNPLPTWLACAKANPPPSKRTTPHGTIFSAALQDNRVGKGLPWDRSVEGN